ncbi:MAG: transcription termination/antitermination protein NusG [Eubacteriaceae bacterium]|nr:transcription termination/antitermination protein NusG [Eubacteriaceae bacterium]
MSENNGAMWYVAHTYSGYENKVKANIEATVQSRNMEDVILEVVVPVHEVEEMKNGQRKNVTKKVFPCYVLVHMYMTDESWYVVRNTRGVTGFVGPASKPVALTTQELEALGIKETKLPQIDLETGDHIIVTDGPFKDFEGTVDEINKEKRKLKISISMFGRETPVELDFSQVKKA